MPCAATWMDVEMSILCRSDRERQVLYDVTYVWNLKATEMNLRQNRDRLVLTLFLSTHHIAHYLSSCVSSRGVGTLSYSSFSLGLMLSVRANLICTVEFLIFSWKGL